MSGGMKGGGMNGGGMMHPNGERFGALSGVVIVNSEKPCTKGKHKVMNKKGKMVCRKK